ncbi:sdhC [Wigglesworthia glossinidia endosymbiont of Glossina brevipalpis]|uniref:Succinate dehydrogenase cytochrome b556 subunit n=1 Tax=Wigglesworthia glossinidia brevipalpis TaxID=36870 RepID=Q8D2D1_WIGBR|nr:sdhC [Wigglesworthia glossinidia endosymbiont of Glossina brevipalpis]
MIFFKKNKNNKNLKKKYKPINLNLFTINFTKTAISSILHRISGVSVFLSFGFFLWILDLSLSSEKEFNYIHQLIFTTILIKIILWIITTVFFYHIIFGLRHILIDFNFSSEDLKTANKTANISFFIVIVISIILGIYLW